MLLHEIAPERFDISYKKQIAADEDSFLGYAGSQILACLREGKLCLPRVDEALEAFDLKREALIYLFSVSGTRYFALPGFQAAAFRDYALQSMRFLRTVEPLSRAFPAAMGLQLQLWYQRSRYCGRCGEKTVHDEKERMMRCPACGNMIYPQICPSVIIGVHHQGRLLVTKYNPKHVMVNSGTTHAPGTTYALVAGYVEAGETPEDTVRREVLEEVGLRVKNIRYYKSQPWPFSSALLFGYYCELDGEDETVTLEEEELSVAEWKAPEELPDRSQDVSLTSEMMENFRLGRAPFNE